MNNPSYTQRKASRNPWLSDMPAHWSEKRLKFHGQLQVSNVDKKSVEGDQEVLLCNYMDVYKNERITNGLDFMRATASDGQIARFSLRPGDVLFTKDSEDPRDIAVPSVVAEELENVVCGYHLAMLRPENEAVGRFLGWTMRCPTFANHFQVEAKGVTRFGLDSKAIGGCWLPSPEPEEQKAIADYLDRETEKIDALIEEKRRLLELLCVKRMSIAQSMVKNTAQWERFGRIAYRATRSIPDKPGEEYTPIGLKNFGRGIFKKEPTRYEELGESSFSFLREGDLLLSGQFAWEGSISVVRKIEDGCIVSHRYHPYTLSRKKVTPGFLFSFFRTDYGHMLLNQHSRGAAGRNRPLNPRSLEKEKIPVPNLKDQEQIDRLLELEENLAGEVEIVEAYLQTRRTALITAAVTGQMDVRGLAARQTTQNGNFTFDNDSVKGKTCT